jgi:hypothetical protein
MPSGKSKKCVCFRETRKVRVKEHPQDITRLLSLAASSLSLLTLPQTDGPNDGLPQGEERSEQFVLEVSEYFERLDVSSTYSLTIFQPKCLHHDYSPSKSLSGLPLHTYGTLV